MKNRGEHHNVICKQCGVSTKHGVDDFYAKPSLVASILSLALMLGSATFFLFKYNFFPTDSAPDYVVLLISGHLAIPLILFLMLSKAERDRVGFFNRYTVQTRTSVFTERKARKTMKAWPRS